MFKQTRGTGGYTISKFFSMNDNTTQSLDRPWIKIKLPLDTRQTMTKTLWSRNNKEHHHFVHKTIFMLVSLLYFSF